MEEFTDGLTSEEYWESFWDRVTLGGDTLGLKYDICLDPLGKERKRKNNSPRLLVEMTGNRKERIPVSIDRFNPQILISRDIPNFESVADWIKENYPVLIRHWNQEIDDFDLVYFLCRTTERTLRLKKEFLGNKESIFDVYIREHQEKLTRLKKIIDAEKEAGSDDY